MAALWTACLMVTAAAAAAGTPPSVQGGLAELRRELRQLAQHVRGEAAVRDELVELRAEIESISEEVRMLKSREAPCRPQQPAADDPDRPVLRWLQDSVVTLQRQLTDVTESLNTSQILHIRQETAARYGEVQTDIRRLGDAQRRLQARQERERSETTQLRADLAELRLTVQLSQNTLTQLLDEVATLRRELLLDPRGAAPAHHPRRHRHHHHQRHRRVRQRLVADIVDALYSRQLRLDREVTQSVRNVTSLGAARRAADQRLDLLEMRLNTAEKEHRQLGWRLNATDGTVEVRALKRFTSELAQEVDQLETKLDSKMAAVQSELSRLDVTCSQLTATVQDVQAQQTELPKQAKAMQQEMAALSEQQLVIQSQLMTLQADLLTLALDQPAGTAESRDQQAGVSALSRDPEAAGASGSRESQNRPEAESKALEESREALKT